MQLKNLRARVVRKARKLRYEQRPVSLAPTGYPLGRVLLSYLIDPFLVDWNKLSPTDPIHWHSNAWECRAIAKTFLDMGYAVDVIDYTNQSFRPKVAYDIVIDTRLNLERLAPMLPPHCLKILHVDVANLVFQNTAENERLLGIQKRRGVTLQPRRFETPNRGIEVADCATVLGNKFTLDTFRYAGKPLFPIPLSSALDVPWPEDKDFDECRRNYVWIGSSGLVRKGLDVVLEAFAGMPDFHLYVCGAIGKVGADSRTGANLFIEQDFEDEYRRELYETPNIHIVGWADTASEKFREIANRCVGMAYASCCEGQCGGVISCMHNALIPVISYESGVDVNDYGFLFDSCSVADVKRKLTEVSSLPASELRTRARRTWEYARMRHTRASFAHAFRTTMQEIMRLHAAGELRQASGDIQARTSPNILVAENEFITAEDLRQHLDDFGYSVVAVVPSGEEAVAKAKEMQPDLLLVDIGLEGRIDGIEAVKRIREDLNVQVVYLAAQPDMATMSRMNLTAPFQCILKPFHGTELRSVLESSLRGRPRQFDGRQG